MVVLQIYAPLVVLVPLHCPLAHSLIPPLCCCAASCNVSDASPRRTGKGCERSALLLLCDLCGSESAKATAHDATLFEETKNINSDLSTLRRCFQKIISRERGVVPYRDCNLTGLLKPILDGGSGRLAIVCCVHEADIKNTKNTLEFATDAKKIEIDPVANEARFSSALHLLRQTLALC